MSRIGLAFIIAPALVPIFAIVWLPNALVVIVAGIAAYGGMTIIGLPVYLALRMRGWTALWVAILIGFVSGVVIWFAVGAMIALLLGERLAGAIAALRDPAWRSGAIWPSATIGAVVATTFWLIARPDRP